MLRGAGRTTWNWLWGLWGRPLLPEEGAREGEGERREEEATEEGRGAGVEEGLGIDEQVLVVEEGGLAAVEDVELVVGVAVVSEGLDGRERV